MNLYISKRNRIIFFEGRKTLDNLLMNQLNNSLNFQVTLGMRSLKPPYIYI